MYVNGLENDRQENVALGILGAALFSLVGGILWVVLDRVGFVAGICGYVSFICATKGYALFAKKRSKTGVIVSVVVSILMMAIAAYVCLSWEVYDAFKDLGLTFVDCLKYSYEFLADGEIAGDFFLNLGLGLVLCVVASYRDVINAFKTASDNEEPPLSAPTAPTDSVDPPVESTIN